MKYGRSLSFCVRDILRGNVRFEEVGAIVASTLIKNKEELKDVFDDYMEYYWSGYDENLVWDLVNKIWDSGKLYQPRLNKRVCQALYKYDIWTDTLEDAYNSLEYF